MDSLTLAWLKHGEYEGWNVVAEEPKPFWAIMSPCENSHSLSTSEHSLTFCSDYLLAYLLGFDTGLLLLLLMLPKLLLNSWSYCFSLSNTRVHVCTSMCSTTWPIFSQYWVNPLDCIKLRKRLAFTNYKDKNDIK